MSARQTTDALLRFLRDSIKDWVASKKGTVSIAADPWNVLEILAMQPGGLRVVIQWKGKQKRGDYEEAEGVNHKFGIVVSMGRVLSATAGKHLADGALGAEPLYKLVDELETLVRGLQFPEDVTEVTPNFISTDSFTTPEGLRIDAYESTFELGALLPQTS